MTRALLWSKKWGNNSGGEKEAPMGSEMTREFCGVVWGGAPAENGFSLGFI